MDLETIKHLIRTDNLIKFYQSRAWRELRKIVIRNANYECEHCKEQGRLTTANTINRNGNKTKMEVNHKKPLRTHPHLALTLGNLEYLCIDCHNIADGKDRYLQQNKKRFFSPERW
ncbi:HNH endonuclease [Pseudogracilibacillus sp. SE30717A]|uniref:HNH endonuclease n=1 Tax=Pseudogracilibacillus sp. SE30717A TaxID=3098293 RepID=UPI00300E3993